MPIACKKRLLNKSHDAQSPRMPILDRTGILEQNERFCVDSYIS